MTRAIDHPSHKIPVRQWWASVYDHFFIAQFPFFKIRSGNCGDLGPIYEKTLYSDDMPDDFDDIVKRRGEAVSWREIHQSVAPEAPKDLFYRAAWLLSCSGFQKRGDIDLQKKIDTYCEENRIYLPEPDGLPSIMHSQIAAFLKALGIRSFVVFDEFRENQFQCDLAVLAKSRDCYFLPQSVTGSKIWAIHAAQPKLLITCEFDGTEAFIAMSDKARELADPQDFFEIEPVAEDTYSDWLNPKDFFERDA